MQLILNEEPSAKTTLLWKSRCQWRYEVVNGWIEASLEDWMQRTKPVYLVEVHVGGGFHCSSLEFELDRAQQEFIDECERKRGKDSRILLMMIRVPVTMDRHDIGEYVYAGGRYTWINEYSAPRIAEVWTGRR